MREIRLARKGEVAGQKEIWKLCFKDSDLTIDFFYDNRYREDETVLLLQDGEIAAMLTMVPIQTVTVRGRSYQSAMLYAVATHPKYQHRGLATQMLDFTNQYLREKNCVFDLLVPAEQQLFDFYRKQGYQDGFYLRESLLTRERIENFPLGESDRCRVFGIAPEEYNKLRNGQLQGRLYISYADEDISYQKKLSQQSGADIFCIEVGGVQGCAAIERLDSDKILIKEILIPGESLAAAVRQITQLLPAKEYVIRTPAFSGEQLAGPIRPFAMIRANGQMDLKITPADLGYLGFAFD